MQLFISPKKNTTSQIPLLLEFFHSEVPWSYRGIWYHSSITYFSPFLVCEKQFYNPSFPRGESPNQTWGSLQNSSKLCSQTMLQDYVRNQNWRHQPNKLSVWSFHITSANKNSQFTQCNPMDTRNYFSLTNCHHFFHKLPHRQHFYLQCPLKPTGMPKGIDVPHYC